MTGELSEGPSGPGQAGYEHAGYAPGYGESDTPGTGAGGTPPGGTPDDYSSGQGPGYFTAGGYPSGQGPGYAPGPTGGYGQEYGRGYGPGPAGPGPGAPGHQVPGYPAPGYQASGYPTQGYPPQGGYGPAETTPTPWGKIIGISCGVLLLLMLLVAGCTTVALFAAGTGDPEVEGETAPETEEAAGPRIELTASETGFVPGPLYTDGEFTSVDVSVTNTGREDVEVNPLYFRVVDAQGTEHSTTQAIGMDANELGARTLESGQSVSGAITVAGDVDAETVVFEPFFGEPVEVPVT
ncbi:DUF4352 domain-containing protein [Nocardiopsis halotolerans]|uniref:DUF4352 domain-containing protein n=1 Tax=Nocardiopsis halotolerans TaxID=124252 RepID=UPI000369A018|nr:DUF4352 domain-containing protein [Nocardiopsis halotolerans]